MEKDADTWDKFQHCLTSFESDTINSDDQELLNQIRTTLNQSLGISIPEES